MSFPNFTFWSHLLAAMGVEVCCLAALGFVAQRFFRPSAWQRAAWQMIVICLLLLPVSEWTGFGPGTAGFLFGKERVIEKAPPSSFTAIPFAIASGPVAPRLNIPPVAPPPEIWWPGWLWLTGAIIVLGRMAAAQVLLLTLRLRREKIESRPLRNRVKYVANCVGLRRKVSLLRMPKAISPMAFGIVRPSIGLPPAFEARLSVTEQEAVLAHELAHLAALDPLWFLLADFASALLWWHPLVWWMRRSLHSAAELAADEATAMVPDGPGALATCLVALGKEMTAARVWGLIGINGGFRSNLGKRVERLVKMSGNAKRPLPRWLSAAARIATTILVVPTIVLLFGSFQSAQGQKQDSWRGQLQDSWNNSPGAVLLLAALEDHQNNQPSIPATNHVVGPKPPESEPLVITVVLVNPDVFVPSLETLYATNFNVRKIKGGIGFKKGERPPPPSDERAALDTAFSQTLTKYFKTAGVDLSPPKLVIFDSRTSEFIVRCTAADLNIIKEAVAVIDPMPPTVATNQAHSAEIADTDMLATTNMMENAKLLYEMNKYDEAEAILNKVLKGDPSNSHALYYLDLIKEARYMEQSRKKQEELITKIFRVNPYVFGQALKKLYSANLDSNIITNTNETIALDEKMVRRYFIAAGADLSPPKNVFFNKRQGEFMVRATLSDLEIIQHAIELLNWTPPPVMIEAEFVELSQEDRRTLGLNWNLIFPRPLTVETIINIADSRQVASSGAKMPIASGLSTQIPIDTVYGIMSPDQFRTAINAIEQRTADILSSPKITTESGRKFRMSAMKGGEGVEVEALVTVGSDGCSIATTATPTIKSGNQTWQVTISHKLWDGQTLLIVGENPDQPPGKRKVHMVFITPRIIDPAGNRVHTDEELAKRPSIPDQ